MDEEEYLSLQPILPNYEIIGGPVLSDNAITVRRTSIPGADTPRGFGRGQAAARLLREGRLPVNRNTYKPSTEAGATSGYYKKDNVIYGQHENDGDFFRIDEHTPFADTYDVSRIAVVNPKKYYRPAEYFLGDGTLGGGLNVTNDVGYFRPDLDANKAVHVSMPWEDKANVYAHQLVRGLSDTLRQFGVTDEELREAGISGGYAGIDGNALNRIALRNDKIKNAVQSFMGAPDYRLLNGNEKKKYSGYLNEVGDFLRDNYRDDPYVKVLPGDGERYTDITSPHTYASGGSMHNAGDARVNGNLEREERYRDWKRPYNTSSSAGSSQRQQPARQSVNIDDLAIRALRGEFGNGAERKRRLGEDYQAVQRRVNEMIAELQSRRAADAKRRETEANKAMERRADGLTAKRGVRPRVSEPSRETIRSGGQLLSRLDGDDEYDMYI